MADKEFNKKLIKRADFYCHSYMGETDIDDNEYYEEWFDPNGKSIKQSNVRVEQKGGDAK